MTDSLNYPQHGLHPFLQRGSPLGGLIRKVSGSADGPLGLTAQPGPDEMSGQMPIYCQISIQLVYLHHTVLWAATISGFHESGFQTAAMAWLKKIKRLTLVEVCGSHKLSSILTPHPFERDHYAYTARLSRRRVPAKTTLLSGKKCRIWLKFCCNTMQHHHARCCGGQRNPSQGTFLVITFKSCTNLLLGVINCWAGFSNSCVCYSNWTQHPLKEFCWFDGGKL